MLTAPARRLLERETGLEPATSTLARWRSTTELFPREFTRIKSIAFPEPGVKTKAPQTCPGPPDYATATARARPYSSTYLPADAPQL